MTTPILDFVRAYAKKGGMRLHMPGHKGKGVLGIEWADITEIEGADVLYSAEGIIAESERNAASLFGSRKTFYSAEGSSLSIRAMLYLTALYARSMKKRPLIWAGRNAHKALLCAAAQLDIDLEFLIG
ncbi:MAG: amino acid decarboxylase, partial [Clostridia bacterium]|nr:amino acid decarboxylase [Clostridia bacterium]